MSEGCIPTVSPSVCRRQTSPREKRDLGEKKGVFSPPSGGDVLRSKTEGAEQ